MRIFPANLASDKNLYIVFVLDIILAVLLIYHKHLRFFLGLIFNYWSLGNCQHFQNPYGDGSEIKFSL